MRDSLTSENVRDFSARYRNTFGWLIGENDKRTLVQVTAVSDDKVRFVDIRGAEYFASADKGVQFEFLPVTRGVFNIGNGQVVFVCRVPARQWHRGICANNTQLFVIDPKHGLEQLPVDLKYVNLLFNTKVDVKDLVNRFLADAVKSVALDKHFALVGDKVWFMNNPIGSITSNNIKLDNDMFRQELSDVIRRNSYSLVLN